MPDNNQTVLEQIVASKHSETAPKLDVSTYFELYVSEQVLKGYDLSYGEIEAGLVGAGGDGGIDSIYIFANGQLVDDDTDTTGFGKDVSIQLFIIQSKFEAGFKELAVERFIPAAQDLLDPSKPLKPVRKLYNSNLLRIIENFRRLYGDVMVNLPKLNISYFIAQKGPRFTPTSN